MRLDLNTIVNNVNRSPIAMILFGSYARNEQDHNSDIDVLIIENTRAPSYYKGKINYSVYTKKQLLNLAQEGSLFILHIISEGKHIYGDKKLIEEIRANFKKPDNYLIYRNKIIETAKILDVTEKFYSLKYKKLNKLLSFLFRSFVYSTFVDKGIIVFSMNYISNELKDPRLTIIKELKNLETENFNLYNLCKKLLQEYLNIKIKNEFISLEALIINFYPKNELGMALGLKIINKNNILIDYDSITRK